MIQNLFEEKEWCGEFYVPDQYDRRFSGKLSYSPETGVMLSCFIRADKERPSESKLLHGVLHTGQKCTLIGNFNPHREGYSERNGFTTYLYKIGFYSIAIGDFLEADVKFDKIWFSFGALQEFLFSKNSKYNENPSCPSVISLQLSDGLIEIQSALSCEPMGENITSCIYGSDDTALKQPNECYKSVRKEYPSNKFRLKQDISSGIRMILNDSLPISDLLVRMMKIVDLFALLFNKPVFPASICVAKCSDTAPGIYLETYPSLPLIKPTIELATKEFLHHNMPITMPLIQHKFQDVLQKWHDEYKEFFIIISSIQNETGFVTKQSLYGDIVLYATQLEWITNLMKKEGVKQEKIGKYEYPVKEWGTEKIIYNLKKVFSVSDITGIGRQVSKLRNEIAHVSRNRKLLGRLKINDLDLIAQCLQFTIIGFILDRIGVPKNIVCEYQQRFCP